MTRALCLQNESGSGYAESGKEIRGELIVKWWVVRCDATHPIWALLLRAGRGDVSGLPIRPSWQAPASTSHLPVNCLCSVPMHAIAGTERPLGSTWSMDVALEPTCTPTATVLWPLALPALLDHVLSTQSASPTTLVICADQSTFVQDLAHSLGQHQGTEQGDSLKHLLVPTLHNLATTRHVKLAFCASVQALLAYLTAYDRPGYVHFEESEGRERLVIVNPLALHKPTSSFSVQGLSRSFAAAVEAAQRTGAALHLVECESEQQNQHVHVHVEDDTLMLESDHGGGSAAEPQDPWDQDVPILNVSARRFGSGVGERAWAGRTVTAKRIAARWFRFHNLGNSSMPEEPQ
ncbi:hypothetical protein B5807_11297 [Epicoccum nigrum]|jgi:hypothetical protein|uniref:Uncharacterized protein n=1 Tax=Epicoccum nigrum TaxID=105696 RepID=A0A1Y2LJH6_EPING|nr:hypothetical protein B5807_11297 [Epicoccum nigrum]